MRQIGTTETVVIYLVRIKNKVSLSVLDNV